MSNKANNPDASNKQSDKYLAPGESGTSGTKDASECSSLRIGNLPKPEKVRELPVDDKENKAAKLAAEQNSSLTPDGKRIQNQAPSGAKFPSTTSSGN
jgi:hypothetical protein